MTRGCFGPKQLEPVEIPANGSLVIELFLRPYAPGPFEFELPVYVDDDGLRTLPIKLCGHAVEATP